ncbi:hypothetical protein DC094_04110 [Pelagibaculum spongiae]|uniref:Uncharacterized protein n=1 Tax=Pelagibaculum spongiae TaxID=2080658 RepID=A0A2V1H4T6_9GAMM|nr:hypothetical protein DC094_04110 [Pelagibaculum spongiae]
MSYPDFFHADLRAHSNPPYAQSYPFTVAQDYLCRFYCLAWLSQEDPTNFEAFLSLLNDRDFLWKREVYAAIESIFDWEPKKLTSPSDSSKTNTSKKKSTYEELAKNIRRMPQTSTRAMEIDFDKRNNRFISFHYFGFFCTTTYAACEPQSIQFLCKDPNKKYYISLPDSNEKAHSITIYSQENTSYICDINLGLISLPTKVLDKIFFEILISYAPQRDDVLYKKAYRIYCLLKK